MRVVNLAVPSDVRVGEVPDRFSPAIGLTLLIRTLPSCTQSVLARAEAGFWGVAADSEPSTMSLAHRRVYGSGGLLFWSWPGCGRWAENFIFLVMYVPVS